MDKTLLLALLAMLPLLGCSKPTETISDAEMGVLKQALSALEAEVEGYKQGWKDGLSVTASLTLPLSTGPCPLPTEDLSAKVTQIVRQGEIDSADPAGLEFVELAVKHIAEDLDRAEVENRNVYRSNFEGHQTRMATVNLVESKVGPYVLLIEDERTPKAGPDNTFDPGYVKGRLLFWDIPAKRFSCAAPAASESSDEVKVFGDAAKGLMRDLEVAARTSATPELQTIPQE